VHGCWDLVQQLHRLGLVDEYRVLVFPVVVGEGKRLFHDGAPMTGFEVAGSRTTAGGLTSLVLRLTPSRGVGAFTVEGGAEVSTRP
jgi:dihydrofolate reductase